MMITGLIINAKASIEVLVMQTLSSRLPDTFSLSMNQHIYGLNQVRYPDDLPLLYRWMHSEHVIPQWQLNKSALELQVFFEKMLADDHQRLYLITLDSHPVGYAEIYECARDRIARYYPAAQEDIGIHLLLGEARILGRGHFAPVMVLLADFIFRHLPEVDKAIGEPSSEVSIFRHAAKSLGFEEQKQISLPEKTATLFFWPRIEFYQSSGYNKLRPLDLKGFPALAYQTQSEQAVITTDTNPSEKQWQNHNSACTSDQ
jgi:RimJ/RimL family protein N-acetyltransferase